MILSRDGEEVMTLSKRHQTSLTRCKTAANAPESVFGIPNPCHKGLNLQNNSGLVSAPSTSSTTKSATSSTSPTETTTAKWSPAAFGAGACLAYAERPFFQ